MLDGALLSPDLVDFAIGAESKIEALVPSKKPQSIGDPQARLDLQKRMHCFLIGRRTCSDPFATERVNLLRLIYPVVATSLRACKI